MVANLNTKANRRKLRELAGVAYTREIGTELSKVEKDFGRWRSGEIDPFELSDRIHRFHDGVSRDLYVFYRDVSPNTAVARAVAYRILDRAEIPRDILPALESAIEYFAERNEQSGGMGEEDLPKE
jgi:hypothetical protein